MKVCFSSFLGKGIATKSASVKIRVVDAGWLEMRGEGAVQAHIEDHMREMEPRLGDVLCLPQCLVRIVALRRMR